jgi:hypothetical protein
MTSARHATLVGALLGLGAIALGLLSTHATRPAVSRADGAATVDAQSGAPGELARIGRPARDERTESGLWRAHLEAFEQQRAQGHLEVAIRVVYDAYGAALESRSWESMIAVGDAFMVLGREPGSAAGARLNARQAYLTALIRARRARSVEGALRAAEAFRQLPDRDVVDQCLHVAALIARGDAAAERRVRESRERLAAPGPAARF